MRVYLDQIGCRLNYSEMDTLAAEVRAAGHRVVDRPESADVIVFNSCAVTAEAGRKSRQRVRQLAKRTGQARIAVTGCWATLRPKEAAELPGVSLVVDNTEKELLATLLEPWSAEFADVDTLMRVQPDGTPFAVEESSSIDERRVRTRAFIKVQDGCNNKCTFCIVTVARGASRSRVTSSIVAEIQALAQSGVKEAILTGVHLGSFGRDLGATEQSNLRDLTDTILRETEISRLRLSSLEPWELAEGFFDLWAKWPQRLCPHLHLPLQAGTDKQLRQMARRCTTESYRELVRSARSAIPDLALTTDLIVGFPGESDADFAASLEFVEEMQFAYAHIFPYSARSGTAAAGFGQQVPKTTKKARSRQLHEVVARTGNVQRERFLGQARPVLWENCGDLLADGGGRLWNGYTDNYLRVTTVAPAEVDLHNRLQLTMLKELHGETFHGMLIDDQIGDQIDVHERLATG